jgi:POT family proton-dependent oligopeptide transporter
MTAASVPLADPTSAERHPRGLAYLAFTEAWERFSFYGMQALLVLYMVDHLLLPGTAQDVWGLEGLRAGLESVFGPLSTQAFASQIFGLYTGFVYFTPVFGGMLGDRVLGPRRTVVLGALLLALGHLLMAFEASFVLALMILVLGVGCLKGNISTQVGRLYPKDDPRRSHAFSLFNVAINTGAFAAPLVCGTLGEVYGWAWGFGAAALGMLIGLAIYLAGGRHLPPDTLRARDPKVARPKLQPGDGRVLGALFVMLILGTFFSIAYAQEFNVFPLWARETLSRDLFGWTMPVTWFAALDGAFVVGLTPIVLRIWQAQARRAAEPSDVGKMAIGAGLGAAGMACLAAASLLAGQGAHVSMLWGVACFALCAAGFLYQWPPTLALISNAAPGPVNATMMGGAFFFSGFVSNYLAGWLGGFYGVMSPGGFWLMHGGISLVGALATWVAIRPLNRILTPTSGTAPEAKATGVLA